MSEERESESKLVSKLANAAIHLVARVAIRLQSPLRAKRIVDAVARVFPTVADDASARAIARQLEGSGTCLTRSLTIASRVPGAEVVIGAGGAPRPNAPAHAWVVRGGLIVGEDSGPAVREEMARLS